MVVLFSSRAYIYQPAKKGHRLRAHTSPETTERRLVQAFKLIEDGENSSDEDAVVEAIHQRSRR
jgi:hypothetical protein